MDDNTTEWMDATALDDVPADDVIGILVADGVQRNVATVDRDAENVVGGQLVGSERVDPVCFAHIG